MNPGEVWSGYIAADEVATPWGYAKEMRTHRSKPGRSRSGGGRNQRERLFAATVASTATKGYPATTVADLISLAGVSRSTFYEHFEDKADCFKATVETLIEAGLEAVRSQLQGPGNPRERGEGALRSLLQLCASQPAAARVALVDAYSAGPTGLDLINKAFEDSCQLAHEALRMLPNKDRTPEQLSRAVIGGLHRVIYIHLYRNEADALLSNCGELWRWASGYAAPDELPDRRSPRRRRSVAREPGEGRDRHERILRGFARTVAARGFSKMTVPQVAAEAGISNATFYQHFENKEDAFLAALDLSGAQLIAATLPAARRERGWPHAVRRAIEGLCAFLISEPAFARLRAVEVYAAGPEAIEHRDRPWEDILEELVPAEVREGHDPGPLAICASSGGLYALVYEKVRKEEGEKLAEMPPILTYIMLAPLIGCDVAVAVAAGRSSIHS